MENVQIPAIPADVPPVGPVPTAAEVVFAKDRKKAFNRRRIFGVPIDVNAVITAEANSIVVCSHIYNC